MRFEKNNIAFLRVNCYKRAQKEDKHFLIIRKLIDRLDKSIEAMISRKSIALNTKSMNQNLRNSSRKGL